MTSNTCFTGVLGSTNFDLQLSHQGEHVTLVSLTVQGHVVRSYCIVHGGILGFGTARMVPGDVQRAGFFVSEDSALASGKKSCKNGTKSLAGCCIAEG